MLPRKFRGSIVRLNLLSVHGGGSDRLAARDAGSRRIAAMSRLGERDMTARLAHSRSSFYRVGGVYMPSRPQRLGPGLALGLLTMLLVGSQSVALLGVAVRPSNVRGALPQSPAGGRTWGENLLHAFGSYTAVVGGIVGAPAPTRLIPVPRSVPAPGSSQAVDIYSFTGAANPKAKVAALPAVVDGVSWDFPWKDIEKKPGVYDWSAVDAAISASAGSGRKTMLRILAGAYSPSWVPNQLTFSSKTLGEQRYQTITMPRPWDPAYIADWTAFIRAYGARYDGESRVTKIQMPGGGYQGEMALPQWPGWLAAGYTDSLMANAWERFIAAYRAAFPHHPSALDVGEPLQVYYHSNILPTVLAFAARYGSEIDYQQNGLRSNLNEAWSVFKILQHLSSSTEIGWQMIGPSGASGGLRAAFTIAIASHARYVEVYQVDCVNPANRSALDYLASNGAGT
jgi:hypothetical protein